RRPDGAAGVSRCRLGQRPDVGGHEGKARRPVIVFIGADQQIVVVVAELRVILEQVRREDAVMAPAVNQVAGVGRLRPAKQQVVVAAGKGNGGIQPAVALRVPLHLWITGADARGCSGEGPEVGVAAAVQAPVVDTHQVVDHFDVVVGPDRSRRVGGRAARAFIGSADTGLVGVVVYDGLRCRY